VVVASSVEQPLGHGSFDEALCSPMTGAESNEEEVDRVPNELGDLVVKSFSDWEFFHAQLSIQRRESFCL